MRSRKPGLFLIAAAISNADSAATAGSPKNTKAIPSPVGKPGTPFQLKVELKPSGALELTWKCDNPAGSHGTLYQIGRKVDGATTFEYVGGAGEKKWTDSTLPAGSSSVTYQIQAVRTTSVGDAAEFIVNIGISSGGAMMASVVACAGPL